MMIRFDRQSGVMANVVADREAGPEGEPTEPLPSERGAPDPPTR